MAANSVYRGWEYARVGDYHRNLDPNWSYTPTYLRKMACVRRVVETLPLEARILDVACGEGVLVEEFRGRGRHVDGLDLNYESEHVRRGDVRNLPYADASYDLVLFLDAIEHLPPADQPRALAELCRVLRPGGTLVISFPNLDHLNSRLRFRIRGDWDRSDSEANHPGERPGREYRPLLEGCGLEIVSRTGITFTLPLVYRRMICRHPARLRWLHDAMELLARLFPSLALLNVVVCRKPGGAAGDPGSPMLRRRLEKLGGPPGIFNIPTHLTGHERMALFDLARRLPPSSVAVEIGSYLGASTCFLAAGARQVGGKVHAVDTWTNLAMSEGARDTYGEFLGNIAPLKEWIVPVRGRSEEAAGRFEGPIDLLFVDGDHSYQGARRDLELWLPRVKDGGTVVLHDYGWAEGVRRAVRELVVPLQFEGASLIDSTWWARIDRRRAQSLSLGLKATVIVPTCDRPELLGEALDSLAAQDFPKDAYEIVVVDNRPGCGAGAVVEEAARRSPGLAIRLVEEPRPGLHHARHAGARAARGELLVYVDDDVLAHPAWLKAILDPFADPAVSAVGGKVLAKWEVAPPAWVSQLRPEYLSLLDLGEARRTLAWPDCVNGCNLAVRRAALYEAGGFNPDGMGAPALFWLRGEGEAGLLRKIALTGGLTVYEPGAWLWHRIPARRLTAAAFRRRALLGGLSDSAGALRGSAQLRFFALRTGYRAARACLWGLREAARAVVSPAQRTRHLCEAWRWYGFCRQHCLAVLSGRARAFLLRGCYFTEEEPS